MTPPARAAGGRSSRNGRARPDPAAVPGARRAAMPADVALQLTLPVARPPAGGGWVHEIKHDGYRLLARLDRGRVRLVTRGGKDWTARFPRVRDDVARLPVGRAVLDGELVAHDAAGRPGFQRLQNYLEGGEAALVYWVFDLLFLDGWDLRGAKLLDRKRVLARLLGARGSGVVRYGGHVELDGAEFLRAACERGLEGIISKRADARYVGGRGGAWLKIKCSRRQEFVVGGWTDPKGGRAAFGALLVGVYDGGVLRYAGRVGTGFDDRTLRSLAARLRPLAAAASPFGVPPRGAEARGVHWVEPGLVVEVAYGEWTDDGRLRHPSFLGVREDKRAREVVRENAPPAARPAGGLEGGSMAGTKPKRTSAGPGAAPITRTRATSARTAGAAPAPAGGPQATRRAPVRARRAADVEAEVAGVRITHPDRVVDRASGTTKLELAQAYAMLAPRLLPHVVDRPLMVVRCPGGVDGGCFHQKHRAAGLPPEAETLPVGRQEFHLAAADRRGLVELVQHGVVELHAWGSRGRDLEHPDRLVFDLDPGEGVPWSRVVEGARALEQRLRDAGLTPFPKYTGGKGIHVVAPLARSLDWDEVRRFSRGVAESLAQEAPRRYTANMSKSERKGRIYVDWLRNARGATAVATWSVRSRPGLPIAVPTTWSALARSKRPAPLDVQTVLRMRTAPADPWPRFAGAARKPDRRIVAALRDGLSARP